jgi:hypothetical protein
MGVSVMNIREMGMLVCDRRVTMKVRMRFTIIPVEIMLMLMMFIMTVRMFMFEWLMHMIVLMRFGKV